MLAWEPGDPWAPLERWMVYETSARWWVAEHDPERLAELEGPSPRRDVDHYCAAGFCQCLYKKNKLVYREGAYTTALIDYWQWRFYQQHKRAPIRYWTIQGEHGGHRFALTPYEAKALWLKTGERDTPKIGALPYADFDSRVLAHLVKYEPLRRRLLAMQWASRIAAVDELIRLDEEARINARTIASKKIDEKMRESADILSFALRREHKVRRGPLTLRKEQRKYDLDAGEVEHNFIHDN